MSTIVNVDTCNGCAECVEACPLDAIEIDGDIAKVDEDVCGDCGACADVCPTESITIE